MAAQEVSVGEPSLSKTAAIVGRKKGKETEEKAAHMNIRTQEGVLLKRL